MPSHAQRPYLCFANLFYATAHAQQPALRRALKPSLRGTAWQSQVAKGYEILVELEAEARHRALLARLLPTRVCVLPKCRLLCRRAAEEGEAGCRCDRAAHKCILHAHPPLVRSAAHIPHSAQHANATGDAFACDAVVRNAEGAIATCAQRTFEVPRRDA